MSSDQSSITQFDADNIAGVVALEAALALLQRLSPKAAKNFPIAGATPDAATEAAEWMAAYQRTYDVRQAETLHRAMREAGMTRDAWPVDTARQLALDIFIRVAIGVRAAWREAKAADDAAAAVAPAPPRGKTIFDRKRKRVGSKWFDPDKLPPSPAADTAPQTEPETSGETGGQEKPTAQPLASLTAGKPVEQPPADAGDAVAKSVRRHRNKTKKSKAAAGEPQDA